MSKREKVILILMTLTILGGGYIYFFDPSSDVEIGSPIKGVDELNLFVADVATTLKRNELSKNDTFVLAQAAEKWKMDPFLSSNLKVTSEVSVEEESVFVEDIDFTYSGYIDMGHRKLAIINGMEYETGEALEQGIYLIREISPVQVVIGISGGNREIILPLEETD